MGDLGRVGALEALEVAMGFSNLTELLNVVDAKLGNIESDKLAPTTAAREEAVRGALSEYSTDAPRVRIHEEAGDGTTRRWVLPTEIVDWTDGLSGVLKVSIVESANTDDEDEDELDEDEWATKRSASDEDVLFVATSVSTSQTLRIYWTDDHAVYGLDSATATTIPARDQDGFAYLVAANLAAWIMRTASDDADHTMGLDQVDFRGVRNQWAENARRLREAAIERVPSLGKAGAGGAIDWINTDRLLGRRRISR